MVDARFTKIELAAPGVLFTLQDRQGKFFSFRHPSFDEFCATAIKLVGLPYQVVDTDQLIGHWFVLGG